MPPVAGLVALLAATAAGCSQLGASAEATPNVAVAGSVVAASAARAAEPVGSAPNPAPTPAAAIAYDREGTAISVQNFDGDGVPDVSDGPIWTCRYFAIAAASGSTFGLGPDLSGGPVTPTAGQAVWLSCPSGHDEFLIFDPARPFGTWAP